MQIGLMDDNGASTVGEAYFPFVNGRCHLKRSMPFFSSELHSLGLRTQKVAVTGSCLVIGLGLGFAGHMS